MTLTVLFGVTRSLLMIVSVAIRIGSTVKPIGMNWMVTSRVEPGGITRGNGTRPTTLNSGESEMMLLTIRSHSPLLPMVSVLLLVLPGQVLSKTMGSLTTIVAGGAV